MAVDIVALEHRPEAIEGDHVSTAHDVRLELVRGGAQLVRKLAGGSIRSALGRREPSRRARVRLRVIPQPLQTRDRLFNLHVPKGLRPRSAIVLPRLALHDRAPFPSRLPGTSSDGRL